jgi:hypothetical protein
MSRRITETLAEFLEKVQRPGLLGLLGKAAQKKCQRELAMYFSSLADRVKEMKFEEYAEPSRGIDPEHAMHAVGMRMHNLLRNRRPILSALLKHHLAHAIEQANAISILAEADDDVTFGFDTAARSKEPADYPGMTADEAASWASEHVDSMIQGLDDTSLKLVADAVSTGITDQLGVAGTARLINQTVGLWDKSRAATIASTEMNSAMSWAFLRKLERNNVEYKQWILGPNPCETCEENAAEGPIPVDEDFPSGDDAPPAHPNCVCAVAGARSPGW